MSLFGELRRRNVFKVGAAYAIVAWLLIQIADVLLPAFGAPEWVLPVFSVMIVLGFPVAVLLAWAYEVTPDGVRAESEALSPPAVTQVTDRKLIYVILALVVVVAGFQITDRMGFERQTSSEINPAIRNSPQVSRFSEPLPSGSRINDFFASVLDLSPDGNRLLIHMADGLYVREIDKLESRLLLEAGSFGTPFFSPDGQSIGYFSVERIERIGLNSATQRVIATVRDPRSTGGAHWVENDVIFFASSNGLYRVSANGGEPEAIIEEPGQGAFSSPFYIEESNTLLFTRRDPGTSDWRESQLIAQSLDTGESKVLIEGGNDARYLPTGHLVYAVDDTLLAVVFDPATLELTGDPVPLVQNLYRNDWSANYAVANNGTLVYFNSSGSFQDRRLVWIDRTGQVEPINVPVAEYAYAVLSPDGTRIALDSRNDEDDIWIFDLERETLQRLTTDPGDNRAPIWLPDGRVAFTREIGESQEVYIQAADGSGDIEQLTTGSDSTSYPTDVSADGKTLFYRNSSIPADVWQVPIGEGVQRGEPIIAGPDSQRDATLSPNGRWLAYQSNESGQAEIYVRPYPDIDSARILISRDGGSHPLWSKDGSELFYLTVPIGTGGALVTVTVDTGSSFSAGLPEQLFEDVFVSPIQGRQVYDVSEDGQRFLMLQAPGQSDYQNVIGDIIFVQNWFEELNRLVPTE